MIRGERHVAGAAGVRLTIQRQSSIRLKSCEDSHGMVGYVFGSQDGDVMVRWVLFIHFWMVLFGLS
jgi:hypothetical protein